MTIYYFLRLTPDNKIVNISLTKDSPEFGIIKDQYQRYFLIEPPHQAYLVNTPERRDQILRELKLMRALL